MKFLFTLLTSLIATGLLAQVSVYGKFSKSNGSQLKGTSTYRGYEDQLIINSYTGGTDNNGIIEIEVPTGSYVADFRNLMNTHATSGSNKNALPTNSKTIGPRTQIKADINRTQIIQQPLTLNAAEITVTNKSNGQGSFPQMKIILQDIIVQSVNDNVATGSSKIKLKASRIGWIYYTYEQTSKKLSGTSKSGWDNAAGKAWTNF